LATFSRTSILADSLSSAATLKDLTRGIEHPQQSHWMVVFAFRRRSVVVVILFVGFAFAYVNRDTPPFDFLQALFQFIFTFFSVAKLRGRTMACWQPPGASFVVFGRSRRRCQIPSVSPQK
jgi:hypothetical protein